VISSIGCEILEILRIVYESCFWKREEKLTILPQGYTLTFFKEQSVRPRNCLGGPHSRGSLQAKALDLCSTIQGQALELCSTIQEPRRRRSEREPAS
jgi:hypothetical protein